MGLPRLARPLRLGALFIAAIAACDGPLDLALPLPSPPALTDLRIGGPSLRDGGVIVIEAFVLDPAFRLVAGTYLQVEVSTSRGDVEEVRLGRHMCGGLYCRLVYVQLADGESPGALEPAVRAAGGRLVFVSPFSPPISGSAWVLSGDRTEFRNRLTLNPRVALVQFEGPFWTDIVDPASLERWMAGALPLSSSPVVPRDGTFSLAAGDTVRLRYTDASGAVLERSWRFSTFSPWTSVRPQG